MCACVFPIMLMVVFAMTVTSVKEIIKQQEGSN